MGYCVFMTANERETSIQENLAAERRVLNALSQEVGIRLDRLQSLQALNATESIKLVPWISVVARNEPNSFVRLIMYSVTLNAANLDERVCSLALDLLRSERDVGCRRVLGLAAAVSKNEATQKDLVDELLRRPCLASLEGILWIAKAAKQDTDILSRSRAVFDKGDFDLEALSVIANTHEREYDLLADAPPHGSRRLTGAECTSVFRCQISGIEYAFRRADLIPYFGVISQLVPVGDADRLEVAARLIADNGVSVDPEGLAAACAGPYTCAKPLAIEISDTRTRAIVLLQRRISGKVKALREFLCLLVVPPPREDNLLPKRLLPPDDPVRFMRAET